MKSINKQKTDIVNLYFSPIIHYNINSGAFKNYVIELRLLPYTIIEKVFQNGNLILINAIRTSHEIN